MAAGVVLSGGTGIRMDFGRFPKQYITVGERPILMYAIDAFSRATCIERIIIVAANEWRDDINSWMNQFAEGLAYAFANPGPTRQHSVINGLNALIDQKPCDDFVVIHDGARPNITGDEIDRYVAEIGSYDALLPALSLKDTIYCSSDRRIITGALDRDSLFAGQAPEVFKYSKYQAINEAAEESELRNTRGSSEIAFRHGMSVKLCEGSEDNYKITTRDDLKRFCLRMSADYEECVYKAENWARR